MNRKATGFCWWTVATFSLGMSACGDDNSAQFSDGRAERARRLSADEQADLTAKIEREFTAGLIENREIKFDTKFGLVEQTLKLYEKPRTIETTRQLARPNYLTKYTQGHDGTENTEKFPVVEAGLLDVLIVMDNSGTMKGMQDLLASSMAQLLKNIQNANWQIAVVTTDSACLRTLPDGRRTLTRADYLRDKTQAEVDYGKLISVGTSGKPHELGILYATEALRGNCGNAQDDWKRPDSNKAVLIVTDEKHCGSASNEGCVGKPYDKAEYFTKSMPAGTSVHGLFLLKENATICPNSGGYDDQYPSEYIRLVTETGGAYGEVCSTDYTETLQRISATVGDRLVPQFDLAYPAETVVAVKVDGVALPAAGYETKGKSLILKDKMDINAKLLEVTYTHGSVARSDIFKLDDDPALETLEVMMDQNIVDPQTYVYDAGKRSVRFLSRPADKVKIEIRYRKNDVLPKTFPYSSPLVADTLKVTIDGVEATGYVVDKKAKFVAFTSAPRDGVEVRLEFGQPGDKKLEYEVDGVDVEKIEDFDVVDAATGEVLTVERKDGILNFLEKDVKGDREVVARYNLEFPVEDLRFDVPLTEVPLDGQVTIVADGNQEICTLEKELTPGNVHFACADDDVFAIVVGYRIIVDYVTSFEMPGMWNDRKDWQVFLDDEPFTDYVREGNTVSIPEAALPVGTRVRIVITPREDDPWVQGAQP